MEKMLTKRQKRITRQVRISADIHREIRKLAIDKGLTVSKLVDEILLENSELNSLLISRSNEEKNRNKKIRKVIKKKDKQITEEFNKISF